MYPRSSRALPALAAALAFASPALAQDERNLLTLGAGAVVVKADSAAEQIAAVAIDGSHQTLTVGIPRREPLPLHIVIELPAMTTFTRFEVPVFNDFGSANGRHIRTIRIEGSATSAGDGFSLLTEARLVQGRDKPQAFPVAAPIPVRWVRATFVDRHAPPPRDIDPHNFTELEGYGIQAPVVVAKDAFTGKWRVRRKGLNDVPGVNRIELTQRGDRVTGCQVMGGRQARISGAIEDGLARLVSEDEQGNVTPFTAVVTRDGQLCGVRFAGPPRAFYAAPDATAAAVCQPPEDANPVAEALADGRSAILYGIHFDVDSDVIRADARPALEELLAALTAVSTVSVIVEGHTDWDGSDAHNLDLSDRRAKAVAAWLIERGIAAARLTPVGRGEARPIADNDTSAGRALNRRVEVAPRP